MRWLGIYGMLLLPAAIQAQEPPGTATATGISRNLNPAISVNALFLGRGLAGLDRDVLSEVPESGLHFQEAEMQFSAAVDPYTKADFIFAVEEDQLKVEEAYVNTTRLPAGLAVRAGQFFVPLGYENRLHTHQLPFIEHSLFATSVFEGTLSEFGASLNYIAPLDFYLDLEAGVFNGDQETLFAGAGEWDLAYQTGFEALWDVSETGAVSLLGDYMFGPNASGTTGDPRFTHLFGFATRYKWKAPSAASPRALNLLLEFLYADRDAAAVAGERFVDRGINASAQYRFLRRWWMQGRFDLYAPGRLPESAKRASFLFAFVPTEFAALRLETAIVDAGPETYTELTAQYNFTMGSHPAHRY